MARHFPTVRVPILIVIPLCLAVIGGTWWQRTRKMDFLTPPSEARLETLRQEVLASLPPARIQDPPQPEISLSGHPDSPLHVEDRPPPPPVDLGDLKTAPGIRSYADRAPEGSVRVSELAALLETNGEFQRALLAWERVIDHTLPDDAQTAAAILAIKRLRPTLPDWNVDPEGVYRITLRAAANAAMAKTLQPVLEAAAREIEQSSAGILAVSAEVSSGRNVPAEGPVPVVIWLAGPSKDTPPAEVLSFTVSSEEKLPVDIYRTVFTLIGNFVKRSAPQLTPPPEAPDPLDGLRFHLTRLIWEEYGKALNRPASPPR